MAILAALVVPAYAQAHARAMSVGDAEGPHCWLGAEPTRELDEELSLRAADIMGCVGWALPLAYGALLPPGGIRFAARRPMLGDGRGVVPCIRWLGAGRFGWRAS